MSGATLITGFNLQLHMCADTYDSTHIPNVCARHATAAAAQTAAMVSECRISGGRGPWHHHLGLPPALQCRQRQLHRCRLVVINPSYTCQHATFT